MNADIRVGTIVKAAPAEGLRKPSLRLHIDFGDELGIKRSCAQLTAHYAPGELIGRQVAAWVGTEPKQIGPYMSECLVLGFPGDDGEPVLVMPTKRVPNGGQLY
ncbi:MAG: tRNA-binding protein [Planctomycetota bacterium]